MPRASSPRGTGSTSVAPEPTVDLTASDSAIPAPRPLTDVEHAAIVTSTKSTEAPTLLPPSASNGAGAAASAVSVGGATGTWTSGVKVNALWAQYATRNAFMSVEGVGWVKLFNATDAAFLALTTLASQAKQTQSQIVYRTEADGMVHEIYLW